MVGFSSGLNATRKAPTDSGTPLFYSLLGQWSKEGRPVDLPTGPEKKEQERQEAKNRMQLERAQKAQLEELERGEPMRIELLLRSISLMGFGAQAKKIRFRWRLIVNSPVLDFAREIIAKFKKANNRLPSMAELEIELIGDREEPSTELLKRVLDALEKL